MREDKLISVVVCTFNRVDLLEALLCSLEKQTCQKGLYEVIIVDNNSTDRTYQLGLEAISRNCNFYLFRELLQGLSYARNRGMQEAKGKYVAYIDDDAVATPNWLAEMASFIRRHPGVVAFGGPYEAFTTTPVPVWFPPEYGSLNYGCEERCLDTGREFIHGTNMVFLRDVISACGGFHPELGMKGNLISYGEETRLQFILMEKGFQVYYAPLMVVRHWLPLHKVRLSWLLKTAYAVGRCSALTLTTQRTLISHFAGLMFGCFHLVRTFFLRNGIPLRRKLYYALVPLISEWGALMEYLLKPSQHRSHVQDQ